MYWNPMSNWPDWFTTSLAIVSWCVMAYLVVFALREGFRSGSGDAELVLETPEVHESKRLDAQKASSRSAVKQ